MMPIKSPSFVVISAVTTLAEVALELCSAFTVLWLAPVEIAVKAS